MRAWKVTYRMNERSDRWQARELLVVTPGEDPAPVRAAVQAFEDENNPAARMRIIIDRMERMEPRAVVA